MEQITNEEPARASRIVYLVFGFIAILMVMIHLQRQTDAICCGDWDGYSHIRWSSLLWENFKRGHWLPSFTWLPLTVLNPQDFADQYFLFHLLQIPFLWFFDTVMAAKASTVFYGTFGIYLLWERKYIWLMPLMFAFVWAYNLFPMLLIAALIWTIIIGWNERRFERRPLVYGAGLILGNVINPYFPHNLVLFLEHLHEKFRFGNDFPVPVAGEWYPYNGLELMAIFPVALLAMLTGYILFMPRNGKLPERATFHLYSQNPDLYEELQDITNAKVDDAGPIIREKFGARFIFADAEENEDMIAKGLRSGWMELVYEDDEARILKIRDQKGQPTSSRLR